MIQLSELSPEKNILLERSLHINLEAKPLLDKFWETKNGINEPLYIYPWHFSPEYSSLMADKRFRYIIFGIGEDKVLCFFKHVRVYQINYIRLVGLPISSTNDIGNVQKVVKQLINQKQISHIVFSEFETELFGDLVPDKKRYDTEIVCKTQESYEKHNSPKFRYRNKIREALKKLQLSIASPEDVPKLQEFESSWKEWKIAQKHELISVNKTEKLIDQCILDNSTDFFKPFVLKFEDIILGYSVYVNYFNGNTYKSQLINKSIYHTNLKLENKIVEEYSKLSGDITMFAVLKWMYENGNEYIYLGRIAFQRSLAIYKRRWGTIEIANFKTPLFNYPPTNFKPVEKPTKQLELNI